MNANGYDYNIVGGAIPAVILKELLSASYSYDKRNPKTIRRWIPDTELSGQRVQVYINKVTGKALVAHPRHK